MNLGIKNLKVVFQFFCFSVFLFFSFFVFAQQDLPIFSEAAISMDFKDVSLKDALKAFSLQSGLNFIAAKDVQDQLITLYLDKVAVKAAIGQLLEAYNLTYQFDPEANIIIVKGKPQKSNMVTKVFHLKYLRVSGSRITSEISDYLKKEDTESESTTQTTSTPTEEEAKITQAVKNILTEDGTVVEEPSTNSLIVTDIGSRFAMVEQLIKSLDVPQPQVMLEVEMLDVSKNSVDKIGLKFGQTPFTMVLTGAKRFTKFPFSPWAGGDFSSARTGTNTAGSLTSGSIDFSTATYKVLLDFLKTQTDTKFLARPRILTLDGETAEIKIATQEAIGVSTTTEATSGTTSAEPERTETGVSLRVTPQINSKTNEITMFLYPRVSEASQGNSLTSEGQTYQFYDPEERATKSVVRIKDGETVIIGGLIRNERSQTITKLPILGDIPLLGVLFRHRDKSKDKQRELLVFITPHIIKDTLGVKLAQARESATSFLLTREQENSLQGRCEVIDRALADFSKER
jgi:type II secretory pathway component GspD/PulD (secretin)